MAVGDLVHESHELWCTLLDDLSHQAELRVREPLAFKVNVH